MSHTPNKQSQSTTSGPKWTGAQAYALAVCCLLLGVALGYLFRGSAAPAVASAAGTAEGNGSDQQARSEAPADLAKSVAPLIQEANRNPNDYDVLVRLGNIFYDGQQFPSAIQYYERALAIHPDNPDVRTDMGTAYWYTGNADQAIAVMETSLEYRPGHPQTLFNLGWVRWQGKADPKGAIAAWEQLLKANPDYPQKQQVEQYIAKAKEHAARR